MSDPIVLDSLLPRPLSSNLLDDKPIFHKKEFGCIEPTTYSSPPWPSGAQR